MWCEQGEFEVYIMLFFMKMRILNITQTYTVWRNKPVLQEKKKKKSVNRVNAEKKNKERMIFHCVSYSIFLNETHFILVLYEALQKFCAIKSPVQS